MTTTYTQPTSIEIGDSIVYDCAAQHDLEATITNIRLAQNGAGVLVPWLVLKITFKNGNQTTNSIVGTPAGCAMYNVRKVN